MLRYWKIANVKKSVYKSYICKLHGSKITFLPEASFGLRVLSLPVCVYVCVSVCPSIMSLSVR